jgi:mRNA (2'-O-methyladenosine-N6-)-methyltransferase
VSPMLVVRSMVAVCVMGWVPFALIDSLMVLRKLENDQNAMSAERVVLREVRTTLFCLLFFNIIFFFKMAF